MYIILRQQNATGSQKLDFKKISRFYLTDSSGSNIHNGIQYSNDYVRSIYAADHIEHSHFFSVKPVYPISFSNDIHSTVNTGNCLGARMFSSQEQMYFTPAVSGNFEVLILTYAHAQLHILNGRVSISRS